MHYLNTNLKFFSSISSMIVVCLKKSLGKIDNFLSSKHCYSDKGERNCTKDEVKLKQKGFQKKMTNLL